MKTIAVLLALCGLSWTLVPPATPEDYGELRRRAEVKIEEGSFALAHRLYEEAAALSLEDDQRRWVDFRLADTSWRSAASTEDRDTTEVDQARAALEKLAPRNARDEERDQVWAEVQESLADLHWDRDRARDWGRAWTYYEAALDWWSGIPEIDAARDRYLGMVWKMAQPTWHQRYWGHRLNHGHVPRHVLENAGKIAREDADVSRARYLLGMHYFNYGQNWQVAGRALRELEAVIELGRRHEWYDDALFQRAHYLANTGRADRDEDGTWRWTPDYVEAVRGYRRLLSEFKKGETAWYDDARHQIDAITGPVLGVSVDRFFLPESEVQFRLSWRNVKRVELALYKVDLLRDMDFTDREPGNWLESIQLTRHEAFKTWSFATKDDGTHQHGNESLTLESPLARSPWVLVVKGGGQTRRAMILVSDASVSVRGTDTTVLAWCTDVMTGEPIAGADVRIWQRWYDGGDSRWNERAGKTRADGTVVLDAKSIDRYSQYFLSFGKGDRQGYAISNLPRALRPSDTWRIYANTDRSTYRPLDEVNWKFAARNYDGSVYSTPANVQVGWEIRDPRGSIVGEGVEKLNAFGTAWTKLATTKDMPLGEYNVQFYSDPKGKRNRIGQANLFRLEEYKLPEFEVTVDVPEDPEHPGKPRLYAVGDRVEFDVEAMYYFGGAVAEANVEVFVYQKPHHHRWKTDREFPWFYPDQNEWNWWGGPGQQILHETIKTDRDGRASVAFDTPLDANNDYEYTIEARVTDSSRREIMGGGTVRVTRQEYYVKVEAKHAIHRSGAPIDLEFTAADPNGSPVKAQGRVRVFRRRWMEIWRSPQGQEVKGAALRRLRTQHEVWPPVSEPTLRPWQMTFRGYEQIEVATTQLTTNAEDGKVWWEFTPDRDGYYQVAWFGEDSRGTAVDGTTHVYVADEDTRELGYLPGGIEILVDKETLEVGEDAAIMLTAPSSGRYVLFTVEGADMYHYEVVHMTGTVKLLRLPIRELHVPNVWLFATSIWDGQAYSAQEELIVPPVAQFLDVQVAHDAEAYLPGETGELQVTVRDHEGNPVEVELVISTADASLSYIQGDMTGDPRQFFFGSRRAHRVHVNGSFHQGSFIRLVKNKEGELVDQRYAWIKDMDTDEHAVAGNVREQLRSLGYAGEGGLEFADASSALGAPAPASRARMEAESGADGFFLGRGQKKAKGQQDYRGPGDSAPAGGGGDTGPTVRVRRDFRDTALWAPAVKTDADGTAVVEVKFPDSTTRWQTTVRAIDTGTRIGIGNASTRTRQPIIARLQAPRFFQTGDVVTISGIVNNNTPEDRSIRTTLSAQGLELLGCVVDGVLRDAQPAPIEVSAGREMRVDWRVRVVEPGTAKLVLQAVGEKYADAMERSLPVYSRGIEVFLAEGGKFDAERLGFSIDVPAARRSGTTSLVVQVTPSMAVTMLDALPYLVDYPYGCTEQTLSRFLPSAIVAKTLQDFGLSSEDAMSRVFGGVEQGFADKTHPDGKKPLAELDRMVKEGLSRLYDFQHSDGGWSWWKTGSSDHFMTAYVVWGLSLAREADVEVRGGVLEKAARYLALELVEEEDHPDLQAWMLHALAVYGGELGTPDGRKFVDKAFANLATKNRTRLNSYTRALMALTAKHMGRDDEARRLLDNLYNGVKIDETPDTSIVQVGPRQSKPYVLKTAHWGNDGIWRRWSQGPVEATAFALRAIVAVDPEHELVEPVTNWLIKNRRGAQWSNTRDTAITVLALNDYLRASGELASPVGFDVTVNGQRIASKTLAKDELLAAPSEFLVDPELIRDGANEIVIERTSGTTPLYFAAHARFFSLEEPIPARGNEIFVRREYYKLVGRPTLLKGYVYDRVPLRDGDSVESGQRIEVVLTVEAKNDLEYMIFEDLKPAGFEAVQVRSGENLVTRQLKRGEAAMRFDPSLIDEEQEQRKIGGFRGPHARSFRGEGYTGVTRHVHQELRDRKVAIFVDKLGEGFWELRYDLRAEVPGSFTAMPLLAHAMYVPEIRANGRDLRVEVVDVADKGE